MRIAFGSDHAGLTLRQLLEGICRADGYAVLSFGAMIEEPYDYPLAADEVCRAMLNGDADVGVVICGSGIGVSIRANRFPGIRCALCTSVEMARLSRLHNHANVLALGQRTTAQELSIEILKAFLATAFDTAERHERRVHQLDDDAC